MKKILLYSTFLVCGYICNAQTVTDIDGNIYHTVAIGSQTWMVENLKTTKYNDGTSIPNVTDSTAWKALSTPGVCTYNNTSNADTINTYGRLYNWYTVNTGKLCPAGWHVPTDAEWTTLTDYLGGESVAGGKLKEIGTTHWQSPNTGATNETGFTALPGGYRFDFNVSFDRIGIYGYWWSSTEVVPNADIVVSAWYRFMYYYISNVFRGNYGKSNGSSVRCLRDTASSISVTDMATKEVIIYPNPTNGILYFSNDNKTILVTIYDFQGKLLLSKMLDNNTIDISGFQNGIYLLKTIDLDKVTINKVIKK
jgi:uncharacterized protein (TIGR02145 family)